jgi:hypothetical protein
MLLGEEKNRGQRQATSCSKGEKLNGALEQHFAFLFVSQLT